VKALIMKENNPNVRMVIGNVISWRMGLTSKFMIDNIKTASKAVP
jgi:hypothetical protein